MKNIFSKNMHGEVGNTVDIFQSCAVLALCGHVLVAGEATVWLLGWRFGDLNGLIPYYPVLIW